MIFFKTKLVAGCVCLILCFCSFWIGIRYNQMHRHRQELALIFNYLGAEITQVNKTLSLLEAQPLSTVQSEYNLQALNNIGCNGWLKYVGEFEQKKLSSFYSGVEMAIEKTQNQSISDDSCAQIIIKKYMELNP